MDLDVETNKDSVRSRQLSDTYRANRQSGLGDQGQYPARKWSSRGRRYQCSGNRLYFALTRCTLAEPWRSVYQRTDSKGS